MYKLTLLTLTLLTLTIGCGGSSDDSMPPTEPPPQAPIETCFDFSSITNGQSFAQVDSYWDCLVSSDLTPFAVFNIYENGEGATVSYNSNSELVGEAIWKWEESGCGKISYAGTSTNGAFTEKAFNFKLSGDILEFDIGEDGAEISSNCERISI